MYFHMQKTAVRGGVIFGLFAAIGMVGVIGAGTMTLLKGPVKTMSTVTKRTLAENSMMAAGKLTIIESQKSSGDCDQDGAIEPVQWVAPAGRPAPGSGGLIPVSVGASQQDPWGNQYGYCGWDHGNSTHFMTCGTSPRRLIGSPQKDNIVIAIISSGPDRIFQTNCNNQGGGDYLVKPSGSDDLVLGFTYAEAEVMSGGLWNLEQNDVDTAEIDKNLSVKDDSGVEQLSFDTDTKELALNAGGTGSFPTMKTDFVENYTGSAVEFLSSIKVSAGETIDMNNNKIVKAALPVDDTDVATKKYVDDKVNGTGAQSIKCESFVFTSCTGAVSHNNLANTNLGACKKACEAANVQCCEAEFSSLPGNPNSALTACHGFNAPSQTSGGLRNLLTILLGGGKFVAALCYLE